MKNKIVIGLAVCLLFGFGFIVSQSLNLYKTSLSMPKPAGRDLPPNSAAAFSFEKLNHGASASTPSSSPASTSVGGTTPNTQPNTNAAALTLKTLPSVTAVDPNLAVAQFHVGDQSYQYQPDRFGAFPRVPIAAGQKVPVTVKFPHGDVGETVTVQTVDGGGLEGAPKMVELTKLDNQLSANFMFQAGNQAGIYRVAVSQRGQTETIQFWVGPLPKMRSIQ